MFNFKHICAISLLLTTMTTWTGSVLAEETLDTGEAPAIQTATEEQVISTDTPPEDNDKPAGGIIIPDVSTPPAVEPVRVKSMQDDAEQALSRGGSQTDTSDRTLALLVLLGLGGFAFFLSRNRNQAAVSTPLPDTAAAAVEEEADHEAESLVSATEPTTESTPPAEEEVMVHAPATETVESDPVEASATDPVEAETEELNSDEPVTGNVDAIDEPPVEQGDEVQDPDEPQTPAESARSHQPAKGRPQKRGRGR